MGNKRANVKSVQIQTPVSMSDNSICLEKDRLSSIIKKLEENIIELRANNRIMKSKSYIENKSKSNNQIVVKQHLLTHTGMSNAQVRLISEPGALLAARIRNEMSATWEVNDIHNGLAVLKKAGIEGYNAFRDLNFVPMPSTTTLNDWCSKVGSLAAVVLLKPLSTPVENLTEKPVVQITVKEKKLSTLEIEKTLIQCNPATNIPEEPVKQAQFEPGRQKGDKQNFPITITKKNMPTLEIASVVLSSTNDVL